MAILKDVLIYILKNYPFSGDLSNARLTKLVYLSDWHQAINQGKQITDINWYFDNFGPFVRDVFDEISAHPDVFTAEKTLNFFGAPKKKISLNDLTLQTSLSEEERSSIDYSIEKTKKLGWDAFIKLVYSTHPIASSSKYSSLDLVQKAAEYKIKA